MSRFVWLFSIACSIPSNALSGTTTCDELTCGAGQLCMPGRNLPDDGGIPARCKDVPASCSVFDCDSVNGPACSSCIDELCGCAAGTGCFIIVRGRTLTC